MPEPKIWRPSPDCDISTAAPLNALQRDTASSDHWPSAPRAASMSRKKKGSFLVKTKPTPKSPLDALAIAVSASTQIAGSCGLWTVPVSGCTGLLSILSGRTVDGTGFHRINCLYRPSGARAGGRLRIMAHPDVGFKYSGLRYVKITVLCVVFNAYELAAQIGAGHADCT